MLLIILSSLNENNKSLPARERVCIVQKNVEQ